MLLADSLCYKYCILEINNNKYNVEQVNLSALDMFSEYVNYILYNDVKFVFKSPNLVKFLNT